MGKRQFISSQTFVPTNIRKSSDTSPYRLVGVEVRPHPQPYHPTHNGVEGHVDIIFGQGMVAHPKVTRSARSSMFPKGSTNMSKTELLRGVVQGEGGIAIKT